MKPIKEGWQGLVWRLREESITGCVVHAFGSGVRGQCALHSFRTARAIQWDPGEGGWRVERGEGRGRERILLRILGPNSFPGLETLVHTDPLCPKVSNTCLVFPHCLLIYFLKQIARHYSAFLFCLSPISWSHVLTRLVPLMGFSSCPNHYSDPASFSLCFSYLSHLAQ